MKFVAWVLFLFLAANFLSSCAHEVSEMLRSKDSFISSKNLSLSDPEEEHGFGTRKVEATDSINFREKAQKGKGSYGGANIVHRRPGDKNGAMFYKPHSLISYMILGYGFFL